jgi:hypothetical protein
MMVESGFESQQGQVFFTSSPHPVRLRGLFPLGKAAEVREIEHSPPSDVGKEMELYLHSPVVFMACILHKHKDNFRF